MKTIKVCTGIGDNIWLLQKLVSAGEKFNILISDRGHQRSHQLFDMFKYIIPKYEYADFSTEDVFEGNIIKTNSRYNRIIEDEFYLSANQFLEAGLAIETLFPDLSTCFDLMPDIEQAHTNSAREIIEKSNKPPVLIYTSSFSGKESWNTWDEHNWVTLVRRLGLEYHYIIIGASYDLDMSGNLQRHLNTYGFTTSLVIDEKLPVIVQLMRMSAYFYAFPSGMPIMCALTSGCPVTMFYPTHLRGLKGSWAPPQRIQNKTYLPMDFCEPEEAARKSADPFAAAIKKYRGA